MFSFGINAFHSCIVSGLRCTSEPAARAGASRWDLAVAAVTDSAHPSLCRFFVPDIRRSRCAEDGGAPFLHRVEPPRVSAALAKKRITMLLQMAQQLAPLHTITGSSMHSPSAARRASSRLNSRASTSASRNDFSNSVFVRSCAFTPGTSSIQPIHQSFRCFTTAVNVAFMSLSLYPPVPGEQHNCAESTSRLPAVDPTHPS